MAWFKVDDKLHAHRKARKAKLAGIGLWTLAGSWSMDNHTDGFVPRDVITQWGTPKETTAAASWLVAAGLWHEGKHDGEEGWRFHDWEEFQPDAASLKAKEAAESEGGKRGNHRRWHTAKRVFVPSCEFCQEARAPDQEPDWVPDRVGIGLPDGVPDSPPISGATPPVPGPVPHVSPNGDTRRGAEVEVAREDVVRVCEHLADRIEANGVKRPPIGKGWHDAARLMLDRDGRTEAQILGAIDWSQADEFWRANILSMSKLREKYDTLALQARRPTNGKQRETDDLFTRAAQRMGVQP